MQPSYRSALGKHILYSGGTSGPLTLGLNALASPAVWFGVIFIRHGLYQDGVFKFTVYIPDNYPDGDCPVSESYSLAPCTGHCGPQGAEGVWVPFLTSHFDDGP